jgi:predicted nuclease of predicted toxin-antitoxin system
MIIADENIDHSLIEAIREAGFDVYAIYEHQRGIADESIIDLSRNPPRLILTEDKDFGEWVFAHQIQGVSVLLLRYHFQDTELIKRRLITLLSDRLPELSGHFTVLTINKLRMRPV